MIKLSKETYHACESFYKFKFGSLYNEEDHIEFWRVAYIVPSYHELITGNYFLNRLEASLMSHEIYSKRSYWVNLILDGAIEKYMLLTPHHIIYDLGGKMRRGNSFADYEIENLKNRIEILCPWSKNICNNEILEKVLNGPYRQRLGMFFNLLAPYGETIEELSLVEGKSVKEYIEEHYGVHTDHNEKILPRGLREPIIYTH